MRGNIESQIRRTISIQAIVATLDRLTWLVVLVSAIIIGWHFVLKYW